MMRCEITEKRCRRPRLKRALGLLAAIGLALFCAGSAEARQRTQGDIILSSTSVAETTYATVNLDKLDGLAIQAVNTAAVSLSSGTFYDGVKSTGQVTISDYAKLHLQASTGSITVVDYTALQLRAATNTVTVVDWTVLFATCVTPSATYFAYGSPSAGDKVYLTGFPTYGASTFTFTSGLPGANEFNDIGDLALLVSSPTEINATSDGTNINLVVIASGTAMTAATITGTGAYSGVNITFTGGRNNATVTVGGTVLTQGTEWTAATSSATTGASLASAIDALAAVNARHDGFGVITTTAATAGAAGNSITLASSDGTNLAPGGATYSNGQNAATVTIGGTVLTESADWTATTSATATGISLRTAIHALSAVNAADDGAGLVTITAATTGAGGNAITLASSDAVNLLNSGAVMTGGQNAATFTINGTVLTESTNWNAETNNDTTATNLAAAIHALAFVDASASGAVAYATSAAVGTSGNYTMVSSSPTAMTASAAAMSGGVDPEIAIGTDQITVTAHGWPNGTKAVFSTVSGSDPTGLSNSGTYYVIKVDANTIKLASSLANAQAGTAVDITALTGSGEYGLTPSAWGSNAVKLQGSNDGTNWSDISGTSTTLTAAGNTLWNIYDVFYRYIRFVYTPSAGATGLTVTTNGKADK